MKTQLGRKPKTIQDERKSPDGVGWVDTQPGLTPKPQPDGKGGCPGASPHCPDGLRVDTQTGRMPTNCPDGRRVDTHNRRMPLQLSQLKDRIIAKKSIAVEGQNYRQKMDRCFEGQNYRPCDFFEGLNSCPVPGAVHSWWVPELPSDLPACPPGFAWLVIPCSESAADGGTIAKREMNDQASGWSVFEPPLADADEPEIKEYMQVQMEEACAGAAWEKCSGGCGTPLKAGRWGVCKACYRNGVPGRVYDCEPGQSLCRSCGVHVKASVGICRPCGTKESTVPEHVQSRTVPKRENRWGRRAACVQQLVARFQLEPGGRRASGAWVYYPDGYEADVGSFGGKSVSGAFLVDSFFQFHVDATTWDYYMGRMLLRLWKQTGLVYMPVCAGGSALSSPSGGGLRYSQLLAELPSGLEVITPVICGNDC